MMIPAVLSNFLSKAFFKYFILRRYPFTKRTHNKNSKHSQGKSAVVTVYWFNKKPSATKRKWIYILAFFRSGCEIYDRKWSGKIIQKGRNKIPIVAYLYEFMLVSKCTTNWKNNIKTNFDQCAKYWRSVWLFFLKNHN